MRVRCFLKKLVQHTILLLMGAEIINCKYYFNYPYIEIETDKPSPLGIVFRMQCFMIFIIEFKFKMPVTVTYTQ